MTTPIVEDSSTPEYNQLEKLEGNYAKLLQDMKATGGSRFLASKRLSWRDRMWTGANVLVSVNIIFVTLLPVFVDIGRFNEKMATALITIASIAILAFSLLQYSTNDPVKSEQHHRCAMEINALRRRLRFTNPISYKLLFDIGIEYDGILQRYDNNHDQSDFQDYVRQHPDEFPTENERATSKDPWHWPRAVTVIVVTLSTLSLILAIYSIFWRAKGVAVLG